MESKLSTFFFIIYSSDFPFIKALPFQKSKNYSLTCALNDFMLNFQKSFENFFDIEYEMRM